MPDLKTQLKNELKGAGRILLLGIGSNLRADDAAGMLVAQSLLRYAAKSKRFKVVLGSTAPENLTGEIKAFKPGHLIIVDSADIPGKAGNISVFRPEEIKGVSFSTHQLPLVILARYLEEELGCKIVVIGIKPKNMRFGLKLSREIEGSVKILVKTIKEAVSGR